MTVPAGAAAPGETSARLPEGTPQWLRDIDATLPITGQYVVHGNLRDLHQLPQEQLPVDTLMALWWMLRRNGFHYLLRHDAVNGLNLITDAGDPGATTVAQGAVAEVLSGSVARLGSPVSAEGMVDVLQRVARHQQWRGGLVFDYLSQQRVDNDPLPEELRRLMLAALAEAHYGVGRYHEGQRRVPLHNARFWLVDRPADLPAWMVGGFDGIRQVPLPLPDIGTRLDVARLLAVRLPEAPTDPVELAKVARRFANAAEGMTLRAMQQTTHLTRDSEIPAARVEDALRAHRVGLPDDPWKHPEVRARILQAETSLSAAVLGQQRAVRHVSDILVRTTLGLASAHLGSAGSGPRGVLFLAGPTGVGKTELAKQMTALLFGDERAYIRFDMSEFAAEHTEARLIGSPPGYVGHGSGGELTNAVRQRPFSLVLFDEIDKAHPKILDKFLQVLSDGRLTDGSGATVHFGETVIVFTSNLGVGEAERRHRESGGAQSYSDVVTEVITEAFRNPDGINRPELLGRIGDNIVVFDPLTADVAGQLAERFLDHVVTSVASELGVRLTLPPTVRQAMVDACTEDLSTGGRGIGMKVQSLVVNPLARVLATVPPGERVVSGYHRSPVGVEVQLS